MPAYVCSNCEKILDARAAEEAGGSSRVTKSAAGNDGGGGRTKEVAVMCQSCGKYTTIRVPDR